MLAEIDIRQQGMRIGRERIGLHSPLQQIPRLGVHFGAQHSRIAKLQRI